MSDDSHARGQGEGGTAAVLVIGVPGWRKHDKRLTESFRGVSETLLERAGVGAGQHVLDVACGTGEPAIPAARRVGPTGQVVATDFVAAMVDFAREKAAAAGLNNIEFRVVDGEQLPRRMW